MKFLFSRFLWCPAGSFTGVVALVATLALGGCAGTAATGLQAAPELLDPEAEIAAAHLRLGESAEDVDAWFRLGRAWQMRADAAAPPQTTAYRDSANVAYDAVLERDPENVKALVHKGLILEDMNRQDDALALYERAVELAPDDALPHINLGSLLYFRYRRTFEAKTALSRALEIDPDNPDAHFNLGVLFADANLFGEAAVEWHRVLELDPNGAAGELARENLARIAPILELENTDGGSDEE